MKSFIDIFKIDELKKYADMRDETMKMKLDKVLNSDEKLNEISEGFITDFINNQNPDFMEMLKLVQNEQQSKRIIQLSYFVAKILAGQKEETRNLILDQELSSSKEILEKMISDLQSEN